MARLLLLCIPTEGQQHVPLRTCVGITAVPFGAKKHEETKSVGRQTMDTQWVEIIRTGLADTAQIVNPSIGETCS